MFADILWWEGETYYSLDKERFWWLQGSIAENGQWPQTTMESFLSQASVYICHALFSELEGWSKVFPRLWARWHKIQKKEKSPWVVADGYHLGSILKSPCWTALNTFLHPTWRWLFRSLTPWWMGYLVVGMDPDVHRSPRVSNTLFSRDTSISESHGETSFAFPLFKKVNHTKTSMHRT